MKRILVPTDFSPSALSALRVAVDIAVRAKGTIILYHVYIPVEGPFIDDKIKRKGYNIEKEKIILKRLQRMKKKVMTEVNPVTISTIIGRSPLVNNILGFAEHNHIDLIVMGTKGASGIKKVLIGSVAAKIVQRTDVPVLLIPAKYEPTELANIIFASNYQPSDQQAFSFTLRLRKLYDGNLTVVHMVSAEISEKKKEKEKSDFDTYARYMQRKFNRNNVKFQLLEVRAGNEKMEMLEKEIPYDILVMLRRKRSFFQKISSGSFTTNMAWIAKKPLLIIPQQETMEEKPTEKIKETTK